MAIVFNNLSAGGGSKLYRHLVTINYMFSSSTAKNKTISIITNFSEVLTNNNNKTLLSNYFGNCETIHYNDLQIEKYDDNTLKFTKLKIYNNTSLAYLYQEYLSNGTKIFSTSSFNNIIMSDTVTEL